MPTHRDAPWEQDARAERLRQELARKRKNLKPFTSGSGSGMRPPPPSTRILTMHPDDGKGNGRGKRSDSTPLKPRRTQGAKQMRRTSFWNRSLNGAETVIVILLLILMTAVWIAIQYPGVAIG